MAEILIYGIVGDAFDKLDAKTLVPVIRSSSGPLVVRINSPGGYVMEGLAIVEALRDYRGKVSVFIDGLAASMASVIAMVGDEIVMADTAMMMIHNPWDCACGDAPELRRAADKLDRIRDQLVGIYGKRTGLSAEDLVPMLDAETWFTAEEALAAGFVTSISQPLRLVAMAGVQSFGFQHPPAQLKEPTVTDTAQAVAAERTRISTIMALCGKHKLPGAFQAALIERDVPLDQARAQILDALASQSDAVSIGHTMGANQTLDNPATYATALTDALFAKISGTAATGPAAEYRGMSVVDIARDYLARGGERDVHRINADRVISMAMRPSGGPTQRWGMGSNAITQTTSDFPDLIGAAADKFLIDRFRRQESELKLLARQRDRSNFLLQSGVQMGGFGVLDTVKEGGEFKDKSIQSRKEGWKIDTYGNMFNVSRQMLVNDALGALSDVLTIMAGAAAETEATLLAAFINTPPLMNDGSALFSTQHGNLAATGAAPSIATLDAGRQAMRQQKDFDGVGLIDANPKYLLVPVKLQTAAETLVASTIAPGTTADVNPFVGKLTPITDPRLSSTTAWFMFADPAFSPALEYGYLNGQTTPFTDSQDGWRVDGTEYKVRHDFGCGWMDYRMAWKNPGA